MKPLYKYATNFAGGLATIIGIGYITSKTFKVKFILNGTVDPSILEIYEPAIKKQKKSMSQVLWISPEPQNFLDKSKSFIKFMYARRLLDIAHCDNALLRKKAVDHLSTMNLDNWQYSLIAHHSDARTAVGIARTHGSKTDFFLAPPRKYGTYNNKLFLNVVEDYLKDLCSDHKKGHECLHKSVSKVFSDVQDVDRIVDSDQIIGRVGNVNQNFEATVTLCLETIRHHSLIPDFSQEILNAGGLDLLMEIYNRFPQNVLICTHLSNIIANVSVNKDALEPIYKSGWIYVLSKWLNHVDIRISGTATQALANLDRDDIEEKFSTDLFLLYPKNRSKEPILVDVVFVHGFLGNVFFTWRNNESMEATLDLIGKQQGNKETLMIMDHNYVLSSDPRTQDYVNELNLQISQEWDSLGHDFEFVCWDIPIEANETCSGPFSFEKNDELLSRAITQCWPRDWLPMDCGNLRIIGLNYSTALSTWVNSCSKVTCEKTIHQRSEHFLSRLIDAGIGKRPIVWVAHSMGGLIVKNIMAMVRNDERVEARNICDNTKGIVFFSTPHGGSKEANINLPASYVIGPSITLKELREDNPFLKDLHQTFLSIVKEQPIKVCSFIETKPTIISGLNLELELVDHISGNPGVGDCYQIPQNHLGICKPCNRGSFLYQKTLDVIKYVMAQQIKK